MNEGLLHLWQHHSPFTQVCVFHECVFHECVCFLRRPSAFLPWSNNMGTCEMNQEWSPSVWNAVWLALSNRELRRAGRDQKSKDLRHSKLGCFSKVTNLHYHWHFRNNELITGRGSNWRSHHFVLWTLSEFWRKKARPSCCLKPCSVWLFPGGKITNEWERSAKMELDWNPVQHVAYK